MELDGFIGIDLKLRSGRRSPTLPLPFLPLSLPGPVPVPDALPCLVKDPLPLPRASPRDSLPDAEPLPSIARVLSRSSGHATSGKGNVQGGRRAGRQGGNAGTQGRE